MNVFRFEMRQGRSSLLGWIAAHCGVILLYMSFLPAFVEEMGTLQKFFQGIGSVMLRALGLELEQIVGPLGFLAFVFTFVLLMAAMQATGVGISLFSKEKRMRTADFLMTRPASRRRIFVAKGCAALATLLLSQLAFYATITVAMFIIPNALMPLGPFLLICLSFGLTQLIFLMIGIFLGVVVRRIKSPVSFSTGVSLGFFLVGVVSSITQSRELRFLAPTRYLETSYIILHHRYELPYLLLLLGVSLALAGLSYVLYTRQDIKAV